jgi:hydroxymethylbilane synthase
MKDVPTWIAEGTVLPCNLIREETNDVFISKKFPSIRQLPDGAVIGSASLRRQAQLLAMNPSWQVVTFRGNVQTRLGKLTNGTSCKTFFSPSVMSLVGVVDATLLALAGLKRLNMSDLIQQSEVLGMETMLPAVAQGAIGIQCRADDSRMLQYLSALNHSPTKSCVDAERAFLAELDGNCRTPIAGQAKVVDGRIEFRGIISKPDGSDLIRVERAGEISAAVQIGRDAGKEVKLIAGAKFIEYQQAMNAVQGGWKK